MYKEKIDKAREIIISMFEMSDDELFSSNKRYKFVDARKMFFLVCHELNIPQIYIRDYLRENKNWECPHSTVSKSIKVGVEAMKTDKEYRKVIEGIKSKI
jgi:hypothetical protein